MTERLSEQEFEEVFNKKGMIEILLELGGFRDQFTELKGVAGLSSSTLSKRLKEGIQHGVWTKSTEVEEITGQTRSIYELTDDGQCYFEMAEEIGLQEEYREFKKAKKGFRYAVAAWFEEVSEES